MANDSADKFYIDFEAYKSELKWLVLEVVTASAKCMYIDAMLILQNSQNGGLQFGNSLKAQQDRAVLSQRRAQLQNLGVFMDSLLQNKSYKSAQNPQQSQEMCKKIENIGSLLRKIGIEIA